MTHKQQPLIFLEAWIRVSQSNVLIDQLTWQSSYNRTKWRMSAEMTIITTRQEMFIPTQYLTRNCTFNILYTQPTTAY